MNEFRSSQAFISINYCTESSKTQFSPVSIAKQLFKRTLFITRTQLQLFKDRIRKKVDVHQQVINLDIPHQ